MLDIINKQEYTPKELRVLSGYSTREVADKIGISYASYRNIEKSGQSLRNTRVDTILKILELYGISFNQLNFFY